MKLDDIPFITKSVENEMPVFTPNTCKLPNQRHMPKNFLIAAEKQNNKFLNNHLAEIEESFHVFKELPKGIINYQASKFGDSLNHDNIFKLIPTVRYSQFVINPYSYPAAGGGPASEFITDGSGSGSDLPMGFETTYASKSTSTGENGNTVDYIALELASAGATLESGLYADSGSGDPEDLEGFSSSTSDVGYVYKSVSTITLETDTQWIAAQKASAGGQLTALRYSTGGVRHFGGSDWEDPYTDTSNNALAFHMKAKG